MPSEKPKNTRQVQLPSGKTIEVMYFADAAATAAAPAAAGPEPAAPQVGQGELHVCPRCASGLVYPVDWAEAGPSHWEVHLRCPECQWRDMGVFSQETVERFDIELDKGAEALLEDLQQLAHANMADEIERFITALAADHIQPCDF